MSPRAQGSTSENTNRRTGGSSKMTKSLTASLFGSKKNKNQRTSGNCDSSTLTPEQFQELWETSEEWHALQTKLHRMELAISKLNQNQIATQTKLEIVHQATISLIRAAISTASLLFLLLVYTLWVVIPTLHTDKQIPMFSGMFISSAVIFIMFVFKFSKLFSVFLTLDNMVDEYEDDEDDMSISSATVSISNLSLASRGQDLLPVGVSREVMRRRSTVLLEPLLREKTSQRSNLSSRLIQQRQSADLPPPREWPHRPVLLCVNTPTDESLCVDAVYGQGPCPIGKPFWFSSDLFEGHCLVRIKNVKNSDDPDSDMAYFDGRRRLFQTIVQGRFKEALPVNTVLTGHEFVKPLKNLPHQWILKAATNLIGKLAPGSDIRVAGSRPTMLAPLAGTSQVVRVDEIGKEPDIASIEGVEEDCTLMGGKFAKSSVSSSARKSYLANPKKASRYTFDVDRVYTFDFYQNLLNVETYKLDLGIASISMCPILNGQPIQCLAKTTDGRYLWSFQIWHESLLPRRKKVDAYKNKKE
jgi:Protein of unknown function (DUF1769)